MRTSIVLLAVACMVLAWSGAALAIGPYAGLHDDFEGYPVGMSTSGGSNLGLTDTNGNVTWSDNLSTQYEVDKRYTTIETSELDGNPNNKVARIRDLNTAGSTSTQLKTWFFWPNTPATTSTYAAPGTYDITMDINSMRTDGAFRIALTDTAAQTTAGNWPAALQFGTTVGTNNNTWAPGLTNGVAHIGYMVAAGSPQTWADSGFTYAADHWYTLKFTVDTVNKQYGAYIKDRGAANWTSLTPGMTEWVYQPNKTDDPNTSVDERHAENLAGMIFLTCGTAAGAGDTVDFKIDNFNVVPEPSGILALMAGGIGCLGFAWRRRK